MRKLSVVALAFFCAGSPLLSQGAPAEAKCATPDSIAVLGNKRVASTTILLDAGITPGTQLNSPMLQRAERNVFAGGQFDNIAVECVLTKTTPPKAVLLIRVVERPLLESTDVVGTSAISASTVKEKVDLVFGRPIDPAAIALVIQHIDSIYQANGYYLARIAAETTFTDSSHASVIFHIEEGSRLAVSGVRVAGNSAVPTKDIVANMKVKPEGFFFWQKGEFGPGELFEGPGRTDTGALLLARIHRFSDPEGLPDRRSNARKGAHRPLRRGRTSVQGRQLRRDR